MIDATPFPLTRRASDDAYEPPLRWIRWRPCVRIIPSRFPPIDLFERVADPADLEAIYAVESMTNTRLRDEVGDLALVPPSERITGPGSSWIMAPFTHVFGPGGRFSTQEFGAYYAARSIDTAIAETSYHRTQFLAATAQAPIEIGMRVIHADVRAKLHDIRDDDPHHAPLHAPDDYTASQAFATHLRRSGSAGIAYRSVRHAGGECIAVFRPRALLKPRQGQHLAYRWNGTRIDAVYRKSLLPGTR